MNKQLWFLAGDFVVALAVGACCYTLTESWSHEGDRLAVSMVAGVLAGTAFFATMLKAFEDVR